MTSQEDQQAELQRDSPLPSESYTMERLTYTIDPHEDSSSSSEEKEKARGFIC